MIYRKMILERYELRRKELMARTGAQEDFPGLTRKKRKPKEEIYTRTSGSVYGY